MSDLITLIACSLCISNSPSVWGGVYDGTVAGSVRLSPEWKFPTHPNRAWPSLTCLCNTCRFTWLARPQSFKLLIKHFNGPTQIGAKFVLGAVHKTLKKKTCWIPQEYLAIHFFFFFFMHDFSEHLFVGQKHISSTLSVWMSLHKTGKYIKPHGYIVFGASSRAFNKNRIVCYEIIQLCWQMKCVIKIKVLGHFYF